MAKRKKKLNKLRRLKNELKVLDPKDLSNIIGGKKNPNLNLITSELKEYLNREIDLIEIGFQQIHEFCSTEDEFSDNLVSGKSRVVVEIVFDLDFNSVSEKHLKERLSKISRRESISDLSEIVSIREGSIIVQVEVSYDDADKLMIALKREGQYDILGVNVVDSDLNNGSVKQFVYHLKQKLCDDFENVLNTLQRALDPESQCFDDLVVIINRSKRLEKMRIMGTVSFSDYILESTKVVASVTQLVNSISKEELRKEFLIGKSFGLSSLGGIVPQ